jgi:hypothetical protein
MIGLGMAALKVYLAVEPCDMRQGFNGLTIAAIEHLGPHLRRPPRPSAGRRLIKHPTQDLRAAHQRRPGR